MIGDFAAERTDAGEIVRLSFYYVMSVPYVAGLACFVGPSIGGFMPTGWAFVAMLVTAPLVFIFDRTPSRFPFLLWLPWVAVVLMSIAWTDEINRWRLQDAFQILTPFVIAPIASKAIKNQQDMATFLRGFSNCLIILLAGLGLHLFAGVAVVVRPMALTAALLGCVFVAQVKDRPAVAIAGWSGCLLITGLTGSRIATVALLLEWVLLPGFRRLWTKLVVGGVMVILTISMFLTPIFQQRFFGEDGGSVANIKRGEFRTSGRFEAWPELFEEVKHRPWIGAGVGSSGGLVKMVWKQANKPHNDYLRILLEQGILGLACFLFGVTSQLISLGRGVLTRCDQGVVVTKAAILGFIVLLVVAVTDNPIVYGVWFMHPLLALAGVSYSLGGKRRE